MTDGEPVEFREFVTMLLGTQPATPLRPRTDRHVWPLTWISELALTSTGEPSGSMASSGL